MTGSQTCPTVPSPSKLGYRRLMVRSVLSSGIVITGTTSHPLFARTVWPTMRRPRLQFSPAWLSRHSAWRWISVRTPESLRCSPRRPTRNCAFARLSRWKAYENCCTKTWRAIPISPRASPSSRSLCRVPTAAWVGRSTRPGSD